MINLNSSWDSMWIKELCKDSPDEIELDYLDKMRKANATEQSLAEGGTKFCLMLYIEVQHSIKLLNKRKSFQRFTYKDLVESAEGSNK